jgi:hypothetical protein
MGATYSTHCANDKLIYVLVEEHVRKYLAELGFNENVILEQNLGNCLWQSGS